MRIFCEAIFSDILPALRAIIAKDLLETYGMTQEEVSKRLGITQPAVSQYKSGLRGSKVKLLTSNENLMALAKKIAAEIDSGNTTFYEKTCEVCKETRKGKFFPNKELHPFLCLIEMKKVKK